jgi:pilus assembly protein Flp/PilA
MNRLTAGIRGIRQFARSEDAIAVTEYGLLVALIAVLLIGVVTVFGSSIKSWFGARTSTITTV